MKINGRKLDAPQTKTLVIPRDSTEAPEYGPDGQPVYEMNEATSEPLKDNDGNPIQRIKVTSNDIVVVAQAVVDYDGFKALVPEPKVPKIMRRGDTVSKEDWSDTKFLVRLKDYNILRSQYMIVKSLEPTKAFEWEEVDYNKPETWKKYEDELKAAQLTQIEIGRIIGLVMEVNGMDEEKFTEATNRFLRGQAANR